MNQDGVAKTESEEEGFTKKKGEMQLSQEEARKSEAGKLTKASAGKQKLAVGNLGAKEGEKS